MMKEMRSINLSVLLALLSAGCASGRDSTADPLQHPVCPEIGPTTGFTVIRRPELDQRSVDAALARFRPSARVVAPGGGVVKIALHVVSDGSVERTAVALGSGNIQLDSVAVRTGRLFRYVPALARRPDPPELCRPRLVIAIQEIHY